MFLFLDQSLEGNCIGSRLWYSYCCLYWGWLSWWEVDVVRFPYWPTPGWHSNRQFCFPCPTVSFRFSGTFRGRKKSWPFTFLHVSAKYFLMHVVRSFILDAVLNLTLCCKQQCNALDALNVMMVVALTCALSRTAVWASLYKKYRVICFCAKEIRVLLCSVAFWNASYHFPSWAWKTLTRKALAFYSVLLPLTEMVEKLNKIIVGGWWKHGQECSSLDLLDGRWLKWNEGYLRVPFYKAKKRSSCKYVTLSCYDLKRNALLLVVFIWLLPGVHFYFQCTVPILG